MTRASYRPIQPHNYPAFKSRRIEAKHVRPFEPKEYKAILAAVGKERLQPHNQARVKACMQLQRWSGLSLVDAVCLSKDELQQAGKMFRVRTNGARPALTSTKSFPSWLGKEHCRSRTATPRYFFITGEATPKGAVSTIDKMYRQVFRSLEWTERPICSGTHSAWNCSRRGGHPQGKPGARAQLRDNHGKLLCEVEQGSARHSGR